MSLAENIDSGKIALDNLVELTKVAVDAVDHLYNTARACLAERVWDWDAEKYSAELIEQGQHAVHGLAWFATYVETLRQVSNYADRLHSEGGLGELEQLLVQTLFGEYLNQIVGGIPMNQGEFVRPAELDLRRADTAVLYDGPAGELIRFGNTPHVRARLTELIIEAQGNTTFGNCGMDETMNQMREEMRRFVADNVTPHAHEWHLKNEYVPLEIIDQLAELGVFFR